ncbi:MAG: hypothetical protein QXE06_10165 [Candidatus Bathyarchaeia archaeon]
MHNPFVSFFSLNFKIVKYSQDANAISARIWAAGQPTSERRENASQTSPWTYASITLIIIAERSETAKIILK